MLRHPLGKGFRCAIHLTQWENAPHHRHVNGFEKTLISTDATLRIAAQCAAALSDAGLLHGDRLRECVKQLKRLAEAHDEDGGPPTPFARDLHALALYLEGRHTDPPDNGGA
jgi:hypothetical protein